MEKQSLYIYKIDVQGNKVKFPNGTMPAKLGEYTYTAQRMAGTPTLTATLNYPTCLDEEWSGEEFVEFRGERYYVGQVHTSSKDNKSIMYKHELQFISERIVLENVYFLDVVTAGADTYHSNSTTVKFMGDINELVGRLNASMTKSGIGYSVVIDEDITSESKLVSLDNVYLAEALQSIYTIYDLPYYFVGKVCHIGYTENVISTPFEYRKGLISIKKTNANYKIVNRVTGLGSTDNIPFYYPNDDATGTIERSQNLMPSIYRETGGAERFYNALNDTYKIPGTNNYYTFKNLYSKQKVKETKVDFSDIKPTIEGVTNASGQLFGEIAGIAFDANDSDELGTGSGNNVFNGTDEYVHSYFYIKLHIYNGQYGFNLFEQGLEGGTAVINMTSGSCAACKFEIGVTYKDSEPNRAFNPVLLGPTGNLVPGDFEQKVTSQTSQYVERQQNTSTNEVWIAVKKDNTSFGVVMPNATNDYRPSIGDKFVITGIKMPKQYVIAAEDRLEEALIKYMSENNDEKFTFSVNFSRVFLADNSHLADILNENARMYIKYNDKEYLMYVNSFTCKADKNCLYDISVELTDKLSANVSALRSTITEIAGDIIGEKIGSGNNISASDIISKISRYFLSKRTDDRTPHKLSTDTAFEVGGFVSGASGAIVYKDEATGQTIGELDKLRVRLKAYFEQLEIVNVNSVGGKLVVSPGGSVRLNKVLEKGLVEVTKERPMTGTDGKPVLDKDGNPVMETYTEMQDNGVPEGVYRCHFLAEQDGEKVENRFKAGDQAYSQIFNAKTGVSNQVSNRYYWRLVTAVGDDYIDLSKADCDTGSDAPAVGDVVNQRGNRTDVDRQNVLEFSSVDAFSPSITLYQGINSYSLTGKDVVSYGVDKTSGKAFMNVYGEMYVGDRAGNTFVKYTQANGVEIKGKLAVGTTLGSGKTIEQALQDATQAAVDSVNEDIENFTDTVTGQITNINKDITDINTGLDGINENLSGIYGSIGNLQNQIDGAIETWFSDPVPTLTNYPANVWKTDDEKDMHLGDLYYSGEGRAYRFQMDGNAYVWKLLKDSDITKALADAAKAQDTADGKRTVFVTQPTNASAYQVGDIWTNATYPADGSKYKNDILRCTTAKAAGAAFNINHWTLASRYTDDTKADLVQQNVNNLSTTVNNLTGTVGSMKDFTDQAFADGIIDRSEASAIATHLNNIETAKADVKNAYEKVYVNALLDGTALTTLKNAYNAFNAAATELTTSVSNAIADGITTSAERATVDGKYSAFNLKYGDFIAALNAANKYIQDKINANASEALSQIGGLQYLKNALKEDTSIEGGLIQSSVLALGYTNDGGTYKVMSGTSGIYRGSAVGGGIASWWGGAMKDRADYTAANMPADVAKSLIRMDGSGYLANGGIWWGTDGKFHADPQSFIIEENQLGDYLELFQIIYKNGTKQIDYIIPQYVMQKVEVADSVKIGNVWLKYDSTNNAIYVEGKNGDAAGFYAPWVSAGGANPGGGSAGGGASALADLLDVTLSSPKSGQILKYNGTHWVNAAAEAGGLTSFTVKVGSTAYDSVGGVVSLPAYPTPVTSLPWGSITGKPATFAPSAHNHDTVYSKLAHTHTRADITDFAHTHTKAQITDFPTSMPASDVYAWAKASAKPAYTWSEISGKPATFNPSEHTHNYASTVKVGTASYAVSGNVISLPAYPTIPTLSVSTTGTGNAVTDVTVSGHAITVNKGATYNNYTHPSATATTIAAANGKVLSTITVNNLGHVTSVSGKTLAEADIPVLAISKINGLQAALDSKLNKSVFDDLFEKVNIGTSSAPVYAIRAKYGFYSDAFVSAKGISSRGSSSGGASALADLLDVTLSSPKSGQILKYNGTHWVNAAAEAGGLTSFTVKVGSTAYDSVGGVVSLPAYPTPVTSLPWGSITGKPTTFAPSAHTHKKADITDFAHTHTKAQITDFPTSMPASDVYAWAKASAKPAYTWSEISGKPATFTPSEHTHNYASTVKVGTASYAVSGNVISLPAYPTIPTLSVSTTGTGNAVTDVTVSGHAITVNKGATYNNYTHPSATATTIAAANGKVLSAITVNNLGHVTSVSGKTLAEADIPVLAISKINGLQAALDSKLNKSVFDDLFEKVNIGTSSAPVYAIRAKYGFYSDAFVSAKGISSRGSSSGGASALADLLDVTLSSPKSGQILKYNGTHWVNAAAEAGGLTSFTVKVGSTAYDSVGGVVSLPAYPTPVTSLPWGSITGKPATFAPSAHTHKKADITDFPTIPTSLPTPNSLTFTGAVTGTWNGSAAKTVNIPAAVTSLAWSAITSKPTTLSGYGITNAYKVEAGDPDKLMGMSAGAYANVGSYASFVHQNYGGQFAMYARGGLKYRGINANAAENWRTVLDSVNYGSFVTIPTSLKNPYPLTISLNGTSQGAYDGSAAKSFNITAASVGAAASSHTHTFASLTSRPTTLSGYGITDAYTKTEADGRYVTALGTNGNYLTWTKNGTTNNITVPYATASRQTNFLYRMAAITDCNNPSRLDDGFTISLDVTNNSCANKYGTGSNAESVLTISAGKHGTSGYFSNQLAFTDNNGLWLRNQKAGTWGAWNKLNMDSSNGSMAMKETGWYRIAYTTTSDVYAPTFRLRLYSNYSSNKNESYAFSISITYGGNVGITQTSGAYNQCCLPNIRVTGTTGGTYYVDAYYNGSANGNAVYWEVDGSTAKAYLTASKVSSVGEDGKEVSGALANTTLFINYSGFRSVSKEGTLLVASTMDSAAAGGNVSILLYRGKGASWNILNEGGNLKFQSNYTTAVVSYYDVLKLDYNTKNVHFYGDVDLPKGRKLVLDSADADKCLFVNGNSGNRFCFGSSAAQGVNVGSLLVSSSWGDYSLVPTNGIYSKGNILSAGAVTAKATSDRRLKTGFDTSVDYRRKLLALGGVVDFSYNALGRQRGIGAGDDQRHTGVIWQDAVNAGITGFCSMDDDGFGSVNPICPDLIFTMLGAVQMNIRTVDGLLKGLDGISLQVETLEEKVARLERENEEKEMRIAELELRESMRT